jgi:hypothetical protein
MTNGPPMRGKICLCMGKGGGFAVSLSYPLQQAKFVKNEVTAVLIVQSVNSHFKLHVTAGDTGLY